MEQKSIKATISIGVNKGYDGKNEIQNSLQMATLAWQSVAQELFKETGIYITAAAHPSKMIYSTDWGCPTGGEDVVTFTTSANPEFVTDMDAWKKTVVSLVSKLKQCLEQSTVLIEFQEISLVYIKD